MHSKASMLAFKLVIGFIILGIIICTVVSIAGSIEFDKDIKEVYNATAYNIARTTQTYLDMDTLEEYVALSNAYHKDGASKEEKDIIAVKIAEVVSGEEYKTVQDKIATLRATSEANDIYIAVLDYDVLNSDTSLDTWLPFKYIFDSYTIPEYTYVLGNESKLNKSFVKDLSTLCTSFKRVNNYFISQGDYGYNTSAVLPIMKADGNSVVVIGVEIPMSTLQSATSAFVCNTVIATIIVVLAGIALYLVYIIARIIIPIRQMTAAASEFVSTTEDKRGEESSITRLNINTHDELANLSSSLKDMEHDLNKYIYELTSMTAEKERIGAELSIATHIQASMLPCVFPAFPHRDDFDIFATMNPAKEVGGDFYDFFMVDEDHIAIVMADVSGKGVPAALFMVIGKTLIKDHTQPGCDLGKVFCEVNNLLCEANSEELFITAFEGVLDLRNGDFTFVNAGHEMPFICRNDGNYEPYKMKSAFVLAGMEDFPYKGGQLKIEPGDKIFQYTDGVTEATNSNNELYGMDRLGAILNANKEAKPCELLPAIKTDIDIFVGDAPQFDDITMLCLEYKGKQVK